MKKLIVSDATPIISFSRIGKLELFHQIVGEILIPEEVSRELFEYKKADVKSIKHCKWINVGAVKSKSDVELLMPTLDRGDRKSLWSFFCQNSCNSQSQVVNRQSLPLVLRKKTLPAIRQTVPAVVNARGVPILSAIYPITALPMGAIPRKTRE